MDEAIVLDEQQESTETAPKERRGRGKPAAAGAIPKLAMDVAGPRYKTYNSDAPNRNQRTSVAWAWWNALPLPSKEIIDLTVYRDWPTTLDPIEESDAKSIEKILGTDPIQTDQDFVDRFGAGDYRAYLNVNPKNEPRRTLFTAYVKCTHEFRDFPPTDRRIDNVANVDINDKANGSYVAWLRATGKLKDEARENKEAEEMAATSGVMAELVKDMAQDRRELTQKLLEKTEQDREMTPDPPPSAEEKLNESLTLLEKLQSFTKGSPSTDPLAMMNAVIEAAKTLNQSSSPQALAPFMDRISSLEEKLRTQEAEMLRGQLNEIKDQLKALKETPQPSNILTSDSQSVEGIVKRIVEQLVDKPEENPWLGIIEKALPVALPLLTGLTQQLFMPRPPMQAAPSFPMPPGTAMQQQPQAQLPAPAPMPQQHPAQQAQPQQTSGAYTTGNPQLDMLLMMIQVPLADHLRDNATGGEFAEYFIDTYGLDIHTQLASSGVDPIVTILYSYPPLGPILKPLAREQVVKFISDFVAYKPSAEPPAGGAA